MDEVVRIPGT